MAVTQNFLIGRTRKSAGGTRFSTWKGLNVIAAKPMQVKQNVTEAVELNRAKMAIISSLVKKLKIVLTSTYSLGIQKTTEFADAVKFFRLRLLDTLNLDITLLAGASFGTGNATINPIAIEDTDDYTLILEWSNITKNPLFNTANTKVTIIVVNENANKIGILKDFAIGQGEAMSMNLEGILNPGEKFTYAIKFTSKIGTTNFSSKMVFSTKLTWFAA